MRTRPIVAIAAGLALTATACTPGLTWSRAADSAPKSGSAAGSSVAWRSCQQFVQQLVHQVAANTSYDCGTVQVPQDWSAAGKSASPSGQSGASGSSGASPGADPSTGTDATMQIALMRVHRAHQSQRIGSLIVNPGGPGASGVELAAYLSLELPDEILNRFDIVGFDPRGIGSSTPALTCYRDADLDTSFGMDPDPVNQADFDAIAALWSRMNAGCVTKYGATLSLYSTEQAAHDIDAIRAAVGDPKINYLGFSYGTELGAVYAQLYPNHIRSLVLDGAVDPTESSVAAAEGQARGFENAFDQFAAWCRQSHCSIAADPRGAVNAAVAAARRSPVISSGGRQATTGWVLTGVTEALYSQAEWTGLASSILALGKGNADPILALADEYAQRDASGHYANMFDAFTAVSCDDDPIIQTPDQIRALQLQWRKTYPLFGGALATSLLSCTSWPAKRDPVPTGKANGAPPILVVGTTNDPATPYAQTAKLATMLGNATVLTWQGQGHTAYPQTACIRSNVDAYLLRTTSPAAGTICPAR